MKQQKTAFKRQRVIGKFAINYVRSSEHLYVGKEIKAMSNLPKILSKEVVNSIEITKERIDECNLLQYAVEEDFKRSKDNLLYYFKGTKDEVRYTGFPDLWRSRVETFIDDGDFNTALSELEDILSELLEE